MNAKQWILLILVTGLLAGCAQEPEAVDPTATPAPTRPAAATPTPMPRGVTILADGVVQAAQPVLPLAFASGGRLLAVHVQAGDRVQVDDLIATQDDVDAQTQVTQAELNLQLAKLALEDLTDGADPAELAAAQASLSSAKANLTELTKPIDEQQLRAARQSLASAQQALQDLLALPDADAIRIARANLANAEAALKQAQSAYNEIAWRDDAGMLPQGLALQQATNEYEAAQARFNQAQKGASASEIANARAQAAQAQAELDRLLRGSDPDAVAAAEAQVAQAQAALDKLLAGGSTRELSTAGISVLQAQLDLENAQRGLAQTRLTSPVAGAVLTVEAAPGALVGGGSPIVTLLDTTQLTVHTTNLSERDIAQIAPGQAAVVTLKAYPDDPIQATVARVGFQAGAAIGDAATFPVILILEETDLDIRPGMTGRVEIRNE